MAFKLRGNGSDLRRRSVKDFAGKQQETCDPLDLTLDDEIDSHLPVPSISFTVASVVVGFLSVICYWNSCDGEFLFDDSEAIVGNEDLRPETPLEKVFLHDFWGGNISSNFSHKSYRPLVVLTFRLNYWLAGGLKPWGFHFVNIILHAVVSVISLKLYSVLFGGGNSGGISQLTAPKASLVCSLLFAVHPIHTESVAGVVGRADLLCALCFILSFLFYVQCCDGETFQAVSPCAWVYLICSMVCCGLAMLCKEQGITVLGICCVYDVVVVCQIDPRLVLFKIKPAEQRNFIHEERKEPGHWIANFVYRQVTLLFTGLLFLIGRWRVMGSSAPTFQAVDNPASFEASVITRASNYNYLYALNAWLLIVPQWLCFDWSMGCVPLIKSLYDPRMLSVAGLWIVMLMFIFYCLRSTNVRIKRIFTLGLAMVVVPYLPATNILFRVGFVVAERVLYLSSMGSTVIVVLGFTLLSKGRFCRKVLALGIGVLLVLYTLRTIQRSRQWRTEDSLFTSGLSVCPLNAKIHYNIGKVRAEQGQIEEAEQSYREAIRLNPTYDQALNNLGNLIKDTGRLHEAEELLEKAVEIKSDFAAGWMNLGTVKAALKKSEEAEKCYSNALRYRANYPDAYFNLGNLYIELDKKTEAIAAFKTAVNFKNDHAGAWMNHALLLDKTGNRDRAMSVIRQAEKFIPHEPAVHFNLGNMLGQSGQFEEAEKRFLKALELNPRQAEVHGNLGVLYHRWGKHEQAEKYYSKALKLDPDGENVRENLQKLKRTKRQLAKGRPKGK